MAFVFIQKGIHFSSMVSLLMLLLLLYYFRICTISNDHSCLNFVSTAAYVLNVVTLSWVNMAMKCFLTTTFALYPLLPAKTKTKQNWFQCFNGNFFLLLLFGNNNFFVHSVRCFVLFYVGMYAFVYLFNHTGTYFIALGDLLCVCACCLCLNSNLLSVLLVSAEQIHVRNIARERTVICVYN